jgi:16S rRNA (adenine1518-N6/adenine1519-N6)-dimethyltransferase
VHSEVIVLDPLPLPQQLDPQVARTVEQLLKRCFGARRKMLRNTLAGLLPEAELASLTQSAGIGLHQRPQDIPPAGWVALANGLNQAMRATDPIPTPTDG